MSYVADADRIMYECGLEVLHPGGREKTDEMARACGVGPRTRVLDIGGGRGTTACRLARSYGCEVVRVDVSHDMVEAAHRLAAKEGLADRVTFQVADAHALPLDADSFDVILIECVTTLLDRERAFREFRRVLKPGGFLGDLEMTYQHEPPLEYSRELTETWGGFTTFPALGLGALLALLTAMLELLHARFLRGVVEGRDPQYVAVADAAAAFREVPSLYADAPGVALLYTAPTPGSCSRSRACLPPPARAPR